MAAAATPQAEALARLAVEETGYGVVADKVQKNLFASQKVYEFIRPMKTVGVIARHEDRRVIEIAEPFGVVAAVVPSTNPTSTAIYKILIALKARCAIVISPHPSAVQVHHARRRGHGRGGARAPGAPAGAINWMTTVTLEGTQELMKQRDVAVILATGGMGLVRAAYSAGKPAYGVGPGNAPALHRAIGERARRPSATSSPARRSTTACSARRENSVVVDEPIAEEAQARVPGAGRLLPERRPRWTRSRSVLVTPQRLPNPALVGKSATFIAEKCGITVPAGHARADRAARRASAATIRCRSRSCARCSPTTSSRTGARAASAASRSCATAAWATPCRSTRRTSRSSSSSACKKPAFRICVNTPTTHGSIGLTTGLDPAMTLGCGGYGGNITSDNISPRHLLNIKRLAYEIAPAVEPLGPRRDARAGSVARAGRPAESPRRPRPTRADAASAPRRCPRRIDEFLGSRGLQAAVSRRRSDPVIRPTGAGRADQTPLDFVCEDDVRLAIQAGRKLVVSERAIVTPAARDLGEAAPRLRRAVAPLSRALTVTLANC